MKSVLPPGPELDALVAEGFMGWKREPFYSGRDPTKILYSRWKCSDGYIRGRVSLPADEYHPGDYLHEWFSPSTDYNACALVKAELVRRKWSYQLNVYCEEHIAEAGEQVLIVAWKACDEDTLISVTATEENHVFSLLAVEVAKWQLQKGETT